MSTKHKPGPWRIDRHLGCVVAANGAPISGEADLTLTSAAPDMLATLEWLDAIGGLGLHVHERISAAIKKARGEA